MEKELLQLIMSKDVKPSQALSETIKITVTSQSFENLVFKIKKITPFSKIFLKYCERYDVELDTIKFVFDGDIIKGSQTPKILGIEDGDVIDATVQQVGGA